MEIAEKLDVLDLIINTLREHEAALDELIARLERAMDIVENP